MSIKKGSTSQKFYFHLRDSSDGTSKTGLVYNSAGAVASYIRNGDVATTITLATLAAANSVYSSGGFKEVDATKCPGRYRLDVPDAALVAGVDSVEICIGFTGVFAETLEIKLVDNVEKDTFDIVNDGTYGNAQLIRATTPANTLDVEAGGTVGLDFANTNGTHPTVPTVTDVTNQVSADVTAISGGAAAAVNLEKDYDGTGYDKPNSSIETVNVLTGQTPQTGDSFAIVNDSEYGNSKLLRPIVPENVEVAVDSDGKVTAGNIVSGSAAVNEIATGVTITFGTEIDNTYVATRTTNSVYHQIADDAGVLDIEYPYSITAFGTPVLLSFKGRLTTVANTLNIYAYDWTGEGAWEKIGELSGQGGPTDIEKTYDLLTTHVGTSGSDLGIVKIRYANSGLSNANIYIDKLTVGYTVTTIVNAYALASVWYNSVAEEGGETGTVLNFNGLAERPSNNITDAMALLASTKLKTMQVKGGSIITLSADYDHREMIGNSHWVLNLNSKDCDHSYFYGAIVNGICTGEPEFDRSYIDDVTAENGDFHACALRATLKLAAINNYRFDQCYCGCGGGLFPILDYNGVNGAWAIMRHWSGNIEIQKMEDNDTLVISNAGTIKINANCNGGTIVIAGVFHIIDEASGNVTVNQDAQLAHALIAETTWNEALSRHVSAGTSGKTLADLLARIGAFTGASDNTILGFLRALARKDVSAPSDVGGTYNPALHSQEAILERGNIAWSSPGAGGGANNFNITVKIDDEFGATLAGVDVQVMDTGETTTIARLITGSAGTVNVDLDNASYHVFLRGTGFQTVGGNPITLVVSGDTDQEEYMEAFDPGTPTAPDLCRVTNWSIDGSGNAEVGKTWSAKITAEPTISGDSIVSYKSQPSTASNSEGYSYLDLIQTAEYVVNIDGNKYTITVPEESTKKLKDLLPAP
jgi:hypothetical protein